MEERALARLAAELGCGCGLRQGKETGPAQRQPTQVKGKTNRGRGEVERPERKEEQADPAAGLRWPARLLCFQARRQGLALFFLN